MTPSAEGEWTHRPDIEGLRAVAVVLVVLFHASIGGLAGGFVGVDVFFVLSGFLITGLLLRELQSSGTIALSAFYARRARRLLPAAVLVLLVTLGASIVLLPPLLLPGIAADTASAAAYVSNISFAIQATDYFSAAQAPSPILHYWSLGVEEQFYLFWPALLLLVARRPVGRTRRVALLIVVVSAVSFWLSLSVTASNAPWAFFSLPTRAWELGLGAMLAVAGPRLRLVPPAAAAVAGWAGLAMIVVAGIAIDESVPFPGTAALLPTLGAALVVAGGARPAVPGPAGLLATTVPRFLGRISYSLYLWHWPLLVVPAVALGAPLPLPARAALVALAVILAWATQALVEDPFRRGRFIGTLPRRNLATAAALTVSVGLVSVGVGATTDLRLAGNRTTGTAAANEQSLDAILNALSSSAPDGSAVATPSAAPASLGPAGSRLPLSPSAGAGPPAAAARTPLPGSRSGSPSPGRGRLASPGASAPFSPPTLGPASAAAVGPGSTAAAIPASPTPMPAAAATPRPATPDGPVPANLQPSIGDARRDYPESYIDGCHTQEDGHPSTGTCLYGNLSSATTIALFGDSHALAWFPAVERFAETKGWRFLSLTMSTCSPATIPIWVPDWKRVSWECNVWREQAIQRLIAERPAIIVVTGTRGFATTDVSGTVVLSGDERTQTWQTGMQRTLGRLVPAAGSVILLADTPLSRMDPPACLSQHTDSVLACATAVSDAISPTWLGVERAAAERAGVAFIDPERWVCPSSPCPVVLGNFLVYRDAGHLTATFAQALADRLGGAILADVQHRGAAPP